MKKHKKPASRILAAAISTAFTLNFTPFAVFAEQLTETETVSDYSESSEEMITSETNLEEISESDAEDDTEQEETDVVIEEINNYHISINNPAPNNCNVTTTNTTVTDSNGNEESFINFKINIADTEDKHYLIKSVQFGNKVLLNSSNGQLEFEQNDILLTDDIADENGNIPLDIELKQQYQVTFDYDSEYGVLSRIFDVESSEDMHDAITLNQDETIVLKAIPNEGYRVAEVIVDGERTEYDTNDCSPEFELEKNKSHIVSVIFKENCIWIKGNYSDENGIIKFCFDDPNFAPADVAYGKETICVGQDSVGETVIACIKPNWNQFIEAITVNGEPYEGTIKKDEDNDEYYLCYIDNIVQDIDVTVKSREMPSPRLILPELEEGRSCYSSDVALKIDSDSCEFISGEYWIEIEEENKEKENKKDDEKTHTFIDMSNPEIVIPKEAGEKNLLVVCAKFYGKYGQSVTAKSEPFSINAVEPKVGIKIENKSESEPNELAEPGFYNTGRIATLLIYDREDTFPDEETFLSFIHIFKDEMELSNEEKRQIIKYNLKDSSQSTPDSDNIKYDRFEVTIEFTEDGNYSWEFPNYTNLAGMQTNDDTMTKNGENLYHFTIDNTSPKGEIIVSGQKWYEKLLETITFGLYKSEPLSVSISYEDTNISSIDYFIDNNKKELAEEDLKNYQGWCAYTGEFKLSDPNYYVIYARLTDKAGNITYLSPKGMIIASNDECEVKFLNMDGTPFKGNEIYSEEQDLEINVSVKDNRSVPAGIQKIEYWFSKNGKESEHVNLYTFTRENSACEQYEYLGKIGIPTKEYSSADTTLFVQVTDNVGNKMEPVKQPFHMDIDAPLIEFIYQDKDGISIKDADTEASRKAIIQVNEQNFNEQDAEQSIKVNGKPLVSDIKESWNWLKTNEDSHWTHDGNIHTTVIEFFEKGEYTIEMTYTDTVGNSSNREHSSFIVNNEKPTGKISIEENRWIELLKNITFGIFKNDKLTVSIETTSTRNPKIEYYLYKVKQGEEHLPLTEEQLKTDKKIPWITYNGPFPIDKNDNYVVYAKITDRSRKTTYINSDGIVYDDKPSEITFNIHEANKVSYYVDDVEHEYYTDDVTVDIHVKDEFPYSGIKSVEYWTTWTDADGQEIRYEDEGTYGSYKAKAKKENKENDVNKVCDEWTSETITIPYNRSDIKLYVKTIDFAGNENEEVLPLDIDKTVPKIEISYDNNDGVKHDGRYYFNQDRTATIRFTERREHFDLEKIKKNIKIDGSNYSFGELKIKKGTESNHDDDVYILPIHFYGETGYHFEINYPDFPDAVQNVSEKTIAAYDFVIDKTAPTGAIIAESEEGRTEIWTEEDFDTPLTFGFWSKYGVEISADAEDISPVASPIITQFYQSSATSALTETDLDKVKDWKDGVDYKNNDRFTVYCKLSDYAGNVTYLKTNAIIVDDSMPYNEMSAPEITLTDAETGEEFEGEVYQGDVEVNVKVNDPLVNDSYSGLKSISYRLLNMGTEISNGVLYTFDIKDPQHGDLLQDWEGTIIVDSEEANSNDIVLEIYAVDNAMNETIERLPLQIDTISPEISVEFDNNNFNNGMSSSDRTVKISIKERNFDSKLVKLYTTKNGEDLAPTVIWSQTEGTGNGDDTIWYTDVPFSGDGVYTFSIYCMDTAGNLSNQVIYDESGFTSYDPSDPKSPFHLVDNVVEVEPIILKGLTVDTTPPVINVKFLDNNIAKNGKYYQAGRTATITINETNFNEEKANQGISVHGTYLGKTIDAVIDDWKDNGDSHTATVKFSEDAAYSISVFYTDEAGNAGTAVHEDFYVDTIDPTAEISVNSKSEFGAYKGDVIPVIRFEDVNFDEEQIQISLSGERVEVSKPMRKNEDTIDFMLTGWDENKKKKTWRGTFKDIVNNGKVEGKILTFESFPIVDKSFDDIYTFTVSLKDKSGRTSNSEHPEKNSLTFSVNNYGSTYRIEDEKTKKILSSDYIDEASDIIILEDNPNKVEKHTITVFKNHSWEELEEGKDKDYECLSDDKETEWHKYTYIIHKEVFDSEADYEIRFYSVDNVGNESLNITDKKTSDIAFSLDRTPPEAKVINLENNHPYYTDGSYEVRVEARDKLKLSEVNVYLDENKDTFKEWHWSGQEIETKNGEFTFEIEAEPLLSSKSHQLKVICKDASGKENEPVIIDGFKIIVNESVKPWIFVGIGAGAIAIAAAAAVVLHKRRKNNI